MKDNNPQGLSTIALVLITIVVIASAGLIWWEFNKQETEEDNVVINSQTNTTENVNSSVNTSDWLTYTNDEYGYSLNYPSTWFMEERVITYENNNVDQAYWYINITPENPSQSDIQTQFAITLFNALSDEAPDQTFLRVTGKDISNLNKEIKNVDGLEGYYYKDVPALTPYNMILIEKDNLLFSLEQGEISEDDYFDIIDNVQFIDSNVDTSSWLIYTNEEYGYSFEYPQNYQVKELVNVDVEGYVNLSNNDASMSLYVMDGPLDPMHIQGIYGERTADEITTVSVSLQTGYQYREGDAGCGGDNVQTSLTNGMILKIQFTECMDTTNILYSNIALRNQILSTFVFFDSSVDVNSMLNSNTNSNTSSNTNSSNTNESESTGDKSSEPEDEDINDSSWSVYENDLRKFRIQYPGGWEAVEYQDYTVGFQPEGCSYYETYPSDTAYPIHISYSTDHKSIQSILKNHPTDYYDKYELGNVTGYGIYEDYDDIEQVYAPVPASRTVFIQGQYYVETEDDCTMDKEYFRNTYLSMLETFEVIED